MPHLISVLIPAYNAEKWIGSAVKSALDQTWPKKEVIIVDDGSSDATFRIAKRFEEKSVKILNQKNRGASAARNKALSLAQGDFIQWLDADDLLAPTKIERQMVRAEAGQNSAILLSGAWGRFLSRPEIADFTPDGLWENLNPLEWLLRKLEHNLWMPPMVFLTNRKLSESAGLWNEKLSLNDDGEYFSRVISRASEIRFVPEARCFKRSTIGLSHDANLSDTKLNSLWYSISSVIRTVRSINDDSRTRRACLILLNRWSIYFFPQRPDVTAQMQELALEMGGIIEKPTLPKKYRWIQKIFGWKVAKKVQFTLPAARMFLHKTMEQFNIKRYQEH